MTTEKLPKIWIRRFTTSHFICSLYQYNEVDAALNLNLLFLGISRLITIIYLWGNINIFSNDREQSQSVFSMEAEIIDTLTSLRSLKSIQ